jgi:MFS family permease
MERAVMPSELTSPIELAPSPESRLFSPRLALLLAVQTVFGFGWSLYLISPKFWVVALGADANTIGRVSATGALASVLAIPLAAGGLDRIGRRPFFRMGSALIVATSLIYLAVHRMGPLVYVAQAGTSIAFVLAFNASATLIADLAPPERLGQAIGIVGAANMATNAVAIVVAERIAERYGWPSVFRVGAVAGTAALLLSLLMRETSSTIEVVAPHRDARPRAGWSSSATALLAAALTGVAFNALFTFTQPYALSLGAKELRSFFVGFTMAGVLSRTFLGRIGDRFGHRRVSSGAAILYAAAALGAIALDPHRLWPFGALFGMAHGILYPTLNAFMLGTMPSTWRGRAMIFYNGAFNVGSGLGGLGWGALAARSGYRSVFAAAGIVALGAAAVLFRRHRPSRTETP